MFVEHMNESSVKVGDFVRIKVDRRDRHNYYSSALQGVVFSVNDNVKSINVVTNTGILSKLIGVVRNIPVEEYSVIEEGVIESTPFKDVKTKVDNSTFDLADYAKRTMKHLHKDQVELHMNEEDINARMAVSKQRRNLNTADKFKGCKCKNGLCSWRCGCSRQDRRCYPQCSNDKEK